MKRFLNIRPAARRLFGFALASMLTLPLPSLAATVALASQPLTTTTASNVKPNVMFILDDSGTMEYNYLPDWASSFKYRPELHTNSAVNGVAYNPAVTYTPPVYFDATGALDTTTYPSYSTAGSWTVVKRDGFGVLWTAATTDNLVGHASYYTFVDKEYCSSVKKTSCINATAPTTVGGVTYDRPAGLRWCTNAQLTSCQSIKDTSHTFPRYPGQVVQATATITLTSLGNVTGITVNGQQIMSGTVSASGTATSAALRAFASSVVGAINNCTAATTGNCTIAGYSATRLSGTATVQITAPAALGAITATPGFSGTASKTITAFANGMVVPGSNVLTNIVSSNNSYPYLGSGQSNRTDCGGTTCNYQQEMTNYANWWAYYQTRLQAMKTSVSRAFKSLNQNYRVGFSNLCDTSATTNTTFLAVDTFETTQKNNWFKKLFSSGTSCWTPLRGALAKTGKYYAHKVGAVDPVQYSCQQNFAILSTDGYWNADVETGTFGPYKLDGSNVGDQDSDSGTRLSGMYEGPTATSNSLADVAKYYYETDLRNSKWSNCAGAQSPDFPSGNPNVCDPDNVFTGGKDSYGTQHMTTFTMGLGADGVLNFQSDYETATSGDYWDLINGLGSPVTNWPVPAANGPTAIDDLWHAAVNGRGSYFSAKDPDQIITGFNKALTAISAKTGSAAAAATSTLNPVSGDNLVYLASYTTVKWTGNLEARSVDTQSGLVSDTAVWCVEDVLAANTCPSNSIQKVSNGGSDVYNCVVAATAATCPSPGSFDTGTNLCTTQIDVGCKGRLPSQVIPTDNRTIYTAPASGHNFVMFDSNYATSYPASFEAAHVNTLTQWAAISGTGGHTPEKLINYLRGQRANDMNATLATDRLYRARETVMGDTLESQPAYIAAPVFSYTYPGYAEFKAAKASREGMVYVGSNDGMLHAFYGANSAGAPAAPALCVASSTVHCGGDEVWAYVPSMVIPNMWQLADTSYSTKHANFINGSPNIADICIAADCSAATAGDWRTILVSGLNGGGRGYFALDITDPQHPTLLWEFTTTTGKGAVKDDDLGYSFGRPVITRQANGKWVVVVTSGYNNVNPGSGKGFLFVLDAATGDMIGKISTGMGDTTTPSGLAHVAVWNDTQGGNQAGSAYAGDLNGNLWRFNINDATGTDGVSADKGPGGKMLFATLYSDSGTQPITTLPELGLVGTNHVVFVGTGKYLEAGDLTNKQKQTLYALKDVGTAATLISNPRASVAPTTVPGMIRQTITLDASGNTRTGTKNAVDFSKDLGWFVDFPDVDTGSERVNINPKLVLGTLLIPTIVPSATACSPGGYGWLNYFDYSSGAPVDGGTGNTNVSMKFDSPIVGFNVIYIEGTPKLMIITADGDITLPKRCADCKAGEGFIDAKHKTTPGFSTHRTSWREMF